MVHAVDAAYLAAIVEPHAVRTRVVLLDPDRRELDVLTGEDGHLFGGRVAMSRLAAPSRTLDGLTVANQGGIWTPRTAADRFAAHRLVRVERGILMGSVAVMHPLITGVIEQPSQQITWDDSTLRVTCSDLWRRLAKKRLRLALSFAPGTSLGTVIVTLAVAGGWPADAAWYAAGNDDGGVVLPAPLVFDQWSLVPDLLSRIAADHSLWLRVDAWGSLAWSPAVTPSTMPAPVATFEPGETSTLTEVTRSLNDDGLYNATVVISASAGFPGGIATARDMNPLSPTYNPPPGHDPAWAGGGPMGDLVMEPFTTATPLDGVARQRKADALLLEAALIEERHDLSAFADARLEPGDVVTLTVPDAGVEGDQLLDTLAIGLSEGEGDDSMRAETKRIRSLVAP